MHLQLQLQPEQEQEQEQSLLRKTIRPPLLQHLQLLHSLQTTLNILILLILHCTDTRAVLITINRCVLLNCCFVISFTCFLTVGFYHDGNNELTAEREERTREFVRELPPERNLRD